LAKRRTRYEIYAELLDIVARRGSCRLTRASYGANLPVDRAKKSLTFLSSRGFLREEKIQDSSIYRITKRGLEYIETFRHMRKLFAALDEKVTPESLEPARSYGTKKHVNQIDTTIKLPPKKIRVDDHIDIEVELSNSSPEPIFLTEVTDFLPSGFEVASIPDDSIVEDSHLRINRTRLAPLTTEKIGFTLKSPKEGTFVFKPKLLFENAKGDRILSEPKQVLIDVSRIDVITRISSGYRDLDRLLLGGIPENYTIILTSISCDERDLLVKKFLEAGTKEDQITFYVTVEASEVESLVNNFKSSFYLFICNPQADTMIKTSPNVFKLKGVENLTDINIALTSTLRKLGQPIRPRRACIEIISDVLLQHHAIQTRRWLTGLMPELRSKGFTTLAVMNPRMHPPEEVQALLGLFNGEINIFEKGTKKGQKKHLRIKKMINQRYLENEMPLVKAKLQRNE
jgi:predicted transcriptional regulator/KaiC/GvpD/RAD55 family RecA-like ATPase